MAEFQVIRENDEPKYVILPFGDVEALEDYMDELWAEQAVKEFEACPDKTFRDLEDLRRELMGDSPKKRKTARKVAK